MKYLNNKGFTLVELSIVLVIIGLMIGGVLVGQSLISSAKNQSFIRQISQYNISLQNFSSKFKSLPGDSVAFGGDGDGMIEQATGACVQTHCAATSMAGEIASFWQNLSISGLKSANATGYSNDYSTGIKFTGAAANAPKAVLGKNAAIVGARNFYWADGSKAEDGFSVSDCSAMTSAVYSCRAAFTREEAMAVDTKTDDGVPNTGNVFSAQFGHGLGTGMLIYSGAFITSTPFVTIQDYNAIPFDVINLAMGFRFQ